jgi:hypothetical protein
VEWDGSSWTVTSPERIERQIKDWESVNYSPIQPPNTLNAQTTPTEDLSNNLNTTTINTNAQTTPTMGEPGGIITDGGLRYRINADGSRTLLDTATEQTTPTEDFSDYLNTTTINTNTQTTPTVAEQMISPDDAMNQYDISNQTDEVTGVGSGALTAGSLLPKYIDDFQYAAPPGTDIDQVRNLARQTASDKSITALIKDVYNDPAKFESRF